MAANTAIYGIVGARIAYTLSPQIFRELFSRYSIDAVYNRFELKPDQLENFVVVARTLPLSAFNVTIPYKESISALTDRNDNIARATGSVNLVVQARGRLTGYNTDYLGIAATIENQLHCSVRDANVTLLGSGGAARTAYYYLVRNHAGCIQVVHRSTARTRSFSRWARALKSKTKYQALSRLQPRKSLIESDLLINCTPAPITEFIDSTDFSSAALIFEMRYAGKTKKRRGHVTGEYMLAVQAAENFRIMTGISTTAEEIMKIINKAKP